ncbi:hypothetical protein [Oceanicoccus sp. KOV_DT_Chl]|uniref:hypothetical protein n=1 Tax=Oceanicoccus sp. KOV_DT_Chl TaxID=1904639 RepID=UPI000C7DC4D8|nr:hypothetical protein [Oceanicoccus sp. KOV_DT_Chl]
MKLDDAIALGRDGQWQEAQVRVSPQSRSQWFLMLSDHQNKFYILADNEDEPIASDDLNTLTQMIKSLGLKNFTVFL